LTLFAYICTSSFSIELLNVQQLSLFVNAPTGSEHPYALLTLKSGALELRTLEGIWHLCHNALGEESNESQCNFHIIFTRNVTTSMCVWVCVPSLLSTL